MKKNVIKFGLFSMMLLAMVSCKNKEKELADKRISELESYVDSLKIVSAEDREANWDQISEDFEIKNANAKGALTSLDQDSKLISQEKLDASNAKYDAYRVVVLNKQEPTPQQGAVSVSKPNPSQLLRDRLFGAGKIGNDMSFAWVNKNNILKTYENFFQSYKDNKANFTREDYDETKLMYEALDSRKNTVEKNGLSEEDNTKIAVIKVKLAPMFKVNRIGAKSRENQEAKE
ncbi:MAG: hypothetical protein ACRC6O_10135 [Flavobacterium sp.]